MQQPNNYVKSAGLHEPLNSLQRCMWSLVVLKIPQHKRNYLTKCDFKPTHNKYALGPGTLIHYASVPSIFTRFVRQDLNLQVMNKVVKLLIHVHVKCTLTRSFETITRLNINFRSCYFMILTCQSK